MARNRFLEPRTPGRLRIAVSCTAKFPDPEQLQVYHEFTAFRDALDADVHVPHAQIPAGVGLPDDLRWLDDRSLFVQPIREVFEADRDAFRRQLPDRFAAAVRALADATGASAAEVEERWEFLQACSYARLLRALDVDYVHAYYNYDQSLNAFVASALLGVPRGITLCEGFEVEEWDLKVPRLHLATADLIVTTSDKTAETVAALDASAVERCVPGGGPQAVPQLVPRIRELVARADRVDGGVVRAFRERHDLTRDRSAHNVPYVVLATERTGSNLLFEILSLLSAHELFNPDYLTDRFIPIYRLPELQRDEELLRLRETDTVGFLDRVWQLGDRMQLKAMGFKLMYYHAEVQPIVLDYLLGSPDVHVFHVKRRNRLERFLSMVRAEVSGSWYKSKRMKGEGGPKEAVELDPNALLADFASQELREEKFGALFHAHPLLDVDYETFSRDFEGTRRIGAEFLGFELDDYPIKSRKTGKRSLRDAIANYDDVVTALAPTRWAELLDEG